jgi:hypothetical protein
MIGGKAKAEALMLKKKMWPEKDQILLPVNQSMPKRDNIYCKIKDCSLVIQFRVFLPIISRAVHQKNTSK